jgi:tetratricopeptide (TPR) repeat protein
MVEEDPYLDDLDDAADHDPYLEEVYEEAYLPEQALSSPVFYDYGDQMVSTVEPGSSPATGRFTWFRLLSGCLGLLLCAGLIYGTIGLFAVRAGLQERAMIIQTDSEEHFQKGQQHLADSSIDLAVAEFEMALSINPNFPEARQALRQAQQIVQARPTPTSETRSAAAAEIFSKAEQLLVQENWNEAVQSLLQVRDLDPQYQVSRVSRGLYMANYNLGLELLSPEQAGEALAAFEQALVERPDDPEAQAEQAKLSLYLEGRVAEGDDKEKAIEIFYALYENDESYLDIEERLIETYEALGDELFEAEDWCLAEVQYTEAHALQGGKALQAKLDDVAERCQNAPLAQAVTSTPRSRPGTTSSGAAAQATPAAADFEPATQTETTIPATAAPPAKANGSGSIYFSDFNAHDQRWEILAVHASGGSPELVVADAVMPAVSPNGQLLLYRSELGNAEGLHSLNLITGEKIRITTVREHILPRWGSDDLQFLFVAQEGGTGRWLVQRNFADGKSNSAILRDGRTPDWNGQIIAYQGTDPQGNNPGIYLVPFGGGESIRLTNHESDRTPVFSPDGTQVAYMSTRDGNWNIYTVSTRGSAPRQITTYPGSDGLPAWSPDGSQLAYVSDMGGSWAIYTISAAGGTPIKVTEWDGPQHPDWLLAQIDWK